MQRLRLVERLCGMSAALLCLAAVGVASISPVSSDSGRVYQGGRLIASVSSSTSLFALLGVHAAVTALAGLGFLGVMAALAALLHTHEAESAWLGLEWTAAILLLAGNWIGMLAFANLFVPAALCALACAVLGTVRQRRVGAAGH
jgi:hypothetical protein